MSTRSSARRLLSPIEDPERLLSQRNRSELSLLFDLEEDDMAGQAPPQCPIPYLRPMEELLQAPTDGVGDAIAVPPVLANQFKLKIGLLNLVTAIRYHVLNNMKPHSHIRRFMKITQTIKLNNVSSDVVKLLLFPFSLEGAARTWLEKEPPNSITTWNDLNTQEALTIIENKSKVQTSRNKPQVSSASGSSTQDAHVTALTKQVEALLSSFNRPVNSVNGCETCGGPHAYYECQAAGGYTQEDVYATTDDLLRQLLIQNQNLRRDQEATNQFVQTQIAITTRSGITLAGPSVPSPPSSSPKEVERDLESTTD
ncbi:hypothetical protein Tco_0727195 [Tanacetum coccineum]|uniref:Reverse transcriptase domain-containing protein n=1 Tax=Tanacetum coccineum TaxID=301880 RepID=A0ABQ4YHR2_9ASTR